MGTYYTCEIPYMELNNDSMLIFSWLIGDRSWSNIGY